LNSGCTIIHYTRRKNMVTKLPRIILMGMILIILISMLGVFPYPAKASSTQEIAEFSSASASTKIIAIEAGHSSTDPGAPSCDGKYREADITYNVATLLAAKLRSKGYQVVVFRDNKDAFVHQTYLAFVALHVDWCPSGPITGYKVTRWHGKRGTGLSDTNDASNRLAQAIWNSYGVSTGIGQDHATGHYTDNFISYGALNPDPSKHGVSANTPAIIIEMGWMKDPDLSKLLNHADSAAQGIANGIINFVGGGGVTLFKNGTSQLTQDQNWGRANLKVCANNLVGNTVYVYFNRAGRSWSYSQKATSTCVIFWNMDGDGPLIAGTTYYSRAALNQPPDTTWPIPCASKTGGQGLCDQITVPANTPTKTASPTSTLTSTKTITPTNTLTPANTPTLTLSPVVVTNTPTPTPIIANTGTPITVTNTQPFTATPTPTKTGTVTSTMTPTFTATLMPTSTATPADIWVHIQGAGFEFSGLVPIGGWLPIISQNRIIYSQDANTIYTRTRTPPYLNDVDWAKWHITPPVTGYYLVCVFAPSYTHAAGVTNQARYRIHNANGDSFPPAQRQSDLMGNWMNLGRYPFNQGTDGYIYMGDYTGNNPWQLISADAAKFVWSPSGNETCSQ
jgi:N-acetylmuramoyl-L-alanine amidase